MPINKILGILCTLKLIKIEITNRCFICTVNQIHSVSLNKWSN